MTASSMSALGGLSESIRCGFKRIGNKNYLNAFLCNRKDNMRDAGLLDRYSDNNEEYLGNHTGLYVD